jgi:hypothetical protein
MDVRDLDRIGFVTRHFRDMQGLRAMVPFGMLTLFQALVPAIEHRPPALGIASFAAIPWRPARPCSASGSCEGAVRRRAITCSSGRCSWRSPCSRRRVPSRPGAS